jgi:hypothetical protein
MSKEELLKKLIIGQSPLTGKYYAGFSKDGKSFDSKVDVTEQIQAIIKNAKA